MCVYMLHVVLDVYCVCVCVVHIYCMCICIVYVRCILCILCYIADVLWIMKTFLKTLYTTHMFTVCSVRIILCTKFTCVIHAKVGSCYL
jgi:hypothetical protein